MGRRYEVLNKTRYFTPHCVLLGVLYLMQRKMENESEIPNTKKMSWYQRIPEIELQTKNVNYNKIVHLPIFLRLMLQKYGNELEWILWETCPTKWYTFIRL